MPKLICFLFFLLIARESIAEITVFPDTSRHIRGDEVVAFQKMSVKLIGNSKVGDSFDVSVVIDNAVFNDLSVYVVDEINLNFLRQQQPFKYWGVQKGKSPIRFSAKVGVPGTYYLVLDNRHANNVNKKTRFEALIRTTMLPDQAARIKLVMERLYSALKARFVFNDFNIAIRPCNQVNAFSSPDITMCSELLSEFVEKNKGNAFSAVFFHEVGHTLLNLWGLPGYDNEDTADEFAAVVLARTESGKRALYEMMTWFSESNANAEAQNMIARGDRHSLSIQRIRNIQRIIANPEPVMKRWNQVLYEHSTEEWLAKTALNPGPFEDAALASKILATRSKLNR